MLHKTILLNLAIQPIYEHVFMAIPNQADRIKLIFDEIFSMLWTKQKDKVTIVK